MACAHRGDNRAARSSLPGAPTISEIQQQVVAGRTGCSSLYHHAQVPLQGLHEPRSLKRFCQLEVTEPEDMILSCNHFCQSARACKFAFIDSIHRLLPSVHDRSYFISMLERVVFFSSSKTEERHASELSRWVLRTCARYKSARSARCLWPIFFINFPSSVIAQDYSTMSFDYLEVDAVDGSEKLLPKE